LRWLNLGCGLSLVAAPWLLEFPADATANSVVGGVITLLLAPLGRPGQSRYGGGWTVLFGREG
jgi:hypothetical protein